MISQILENDESPLVLRAGKLKLLGCRNRNGDCVDAYFDLLIDHDLMWSDRSQIT